MVHPLQQDVYGTRGRPELLKFVPPATKSVLDVGCARGDFARDLRTALDPVRIVGIEPVAAAARDADASGQLDAVHTGYFPDVVSSCEERFDLICFNDVLEHVVDPWQMLGEGRKFLSPHGRVLASIPNVQYATVVAKLLLGRWAYTEAGVLDKTHLRFFARRSVSDLFVSSGYEIERIQGINPLGTWHEQQLAVNVSGRAQVIALKMSRRLLGDFAFLQYAVVAKAKP